MPLAAGTILGQYEIHSPLGAGGMGEVYRAHDTRLDREVAIKVLPESVTADPERLRRFEQEARAAAALNHPNILAVYQMATQDGVSYMVTELLDGETLRERLRRGPIPLRKAIDYGVQIAHGLAAAHERGIVHRDLKPENLFVTKDGRLKILDFGLAKLTQAKDSSGGEPTLTRATEPGVVMGTVGYMSPEQARGQTADHRSDIFAFGTILYETVTGTPPFRKPTKADTISAILNEDPPPISQLAPTTPPGLPRVIHRCLEKNPEQRFHSAHDLGFALEALTDTAFPAASGGQAPVSVKPNRKVLAIAGTAAVMVIAAAIVAYLWSRPEPVPKVSNYVQLTHDGQPVSLVGTDGSRLYFWSWSADSLFEISASGGEPKDLPILPRGHMVPHGISPDGSEMLAIDGQGILGKGPIWIFPILGGSPRRFGDIVGIGGSWSPNGNRLAYSDGNQAFVANADGTEVHKLDALKEAAIISHLEWSPDGTHVRFDVQESYNTPPFIWEVSLDGGDSHRLFPAWNKLPDSNCCGKWTADGKYFVFQSRQQIWALPQKGGILRSPPQPIQLTSSPLAMSSPVPSKDGKKLFVVGRTSRGELERFDVKSGRFVPFLGGISAEYLDFSRDGEWVAYVAFPEGTLWRSKVDGSERLQLTYRPNYAMLPRWSPDGKKIVFFYQAQPDKPGKIYEVSPDGGTPRELMPSDPLDQGDPNWSPDGNKLVFGGNPNNAATTIRVLDLATRQLVTLPGSQGLYSPRWSPDGRYIVAITSNARTLLVYDLETQKWTELASGSIGWLNWSKDGKYVFVLDFSTTGGVLRVRLSDHALERVVDGKGFARTGRYGSGLSLAPDDSPLLLRDSGTTDVYALDLEEP
jgi:serine/threonine protein kinase/Tol biopolymer transport system component